MQNPILDHLSPSTLVAIIHDLGEAKTPPQSSEDVKNALELLECLRQAEEMLVSIVGEARAQVLLADQS